MASSDLETSPAGPVLPGEERKRAKVPQDDPPSGIQRSAEVHGDRGARRAETVSGADTDSENRSHSPGALQIPTVSGISMSGIRGRS